MANKHDLEAAIREMLPDITKAVKQGVAEQLNARPTRDEIQTLVSQVVAADLKSVIGPSAETTLTGIAQQLTHLNDLLTAPPAPPTMTTTGTTPPAEASDEAAQPA